MKREVGRKLLSRQDVDWGIEALASNALAAIHIDERSGWEGVGQFFDAPKEHRQVGTFGCSAAAMSIHGAQPGSAKLMQCLSTLEAIWNDWNDKGSKGRRFVQTYKLAYMLYALNLADDSKFQRLKDEITETLVQRELATGGWSSWWISEDLNGDILDIPSTSLVVLALCASSSGSLTAKRAIRKLNEYLDRYPKTPTLKICLCLAALGRVEPSARAQNFERILNDAISSRHQLGISEPYHYFVYRYEDDTGSLRFGRDAIVAPPKITAALAAFGSSKTPISQLYGLSITSDVVKDIQKGDGLFRFEEEQFAGSMVQGLAALAIKDARANLQRPLWIVRAYIALFSDKPRDGIWYRIVPTVGVLSALLSTVLTADMELPWTLSSAAWTLVVGSVWGPSVLRRWLPGFR